MIAENKNAQVANLERRGSMLQRFGGVRGHDINREMRINRGAQPGGGGGGPRAPPQRPPMPQAKAACCTIF